MPNRHLESTAASLLNSWTDSDTAMQIVGTSLGLFGPGLLDPAAVLSYETPLRNALFDVLLSLVEGGALDLRPTEDTGYAFRFRTDFATAALQPDTARAVDIDTPSPHLAELIQVRRERDEALGRADFAEALAAERERMLRLGEAPSKRPIRRQRPPEARPERHDVPDEIDLTSIEAEESSGESAVSAVPAEVGAQSAPETGPSAVLAPPEPVVAAVTPTEPIVVEDAPEPAAAEEPEPEPQPEPEPLPEPAGPISGLPPEPEIDTAQAHEPHVAGSLPPEPVIAAPVLPDTEALAEAEPAPAGTVKNTPVKKTAPKKAPQKKAAPKKRVAKKPASKPVAAVTAAPQPPAPETEPEPEPEPEAQPPSEVLYLPPPAPPDAEFEADEPAHVVAADDHSARRAKWSGYTLDKPRAHLSSVDRIADDG